MGVSASGATLEIQLVADVARLKSDMAAMQATVAQATGGAGASFTKLGVTSGAAATAMAASAQASARAAMGIGTAYKATAESVHVNSLALRESLVLVREAARGNYTRMAGSFSLLAQSVAGTQGGFKALAGQLLQLAGVIRVTQNAELAEIAAQKAALAATIQGRAERAASAVMARQAQVAIAQAELAAAVGSNAEAAAQARLVTALRAVEVASGKATIAQEALTGAEAEAAAAGKAANAAAVTSLGGTGIALAVLVPIAAASYAAIKQFQDQVKGNGELDAFAEKLNLTDEQIKKLGGSVTYTGDRIREVQGLTVSFGDVMHGVFQEISQEAGSGAAWDNLKSKSSSAFSYVEMAWMKTSAAISTGIWNIGDLAVGVFQYIGQKIGQSFYDGVNKAIDAINSLSDKIPTWAGGGKQAYIPHLKADPRDATLSGLNAHLQQQSDANYAYALSQNQRSLGNIGNNAIQNARSRYQAIADSNRPKKERTKKPNDHGLAETLAELDAAIKGQLNLANAYLISDAAAIKATALQKAEEDAIKHKGESGVFYEKELARLVATGAAEGAKKIAQLNDETAARASVNAQVAAGTLSYRKMNQALQDETALQPLLVLQSVATGEAYKVITAVINAYRVALAAAHAEEDRSAAVQKLGELNEQHKQAMALLTRETALTGVNKDQRDEILKLLKQEIELRAQFPGMTEAEIAAVTRETAAEDALRKHLDRVEAGMQQLHDTGSKVVDDVFNVDNWTDPFKALLGILKEVEQEFVTLAFANPLKNSLFGQNNPTLGSVGGIGGFFSALFGGGGSGVLDLTGAVPSFASASAAIPTLDIGAFPGLASGGWRPIGGNGGIDQNLLSLNGRPIARVSADESLAVIPRGHGAANQNSRGDTHYHITVAGTGDTMRDRQTGMQYASGMNSVQAKKRRSGTM